MVRFVITLAVSLSLLTEAAWSQTALQFRWVPGQNLDYVISQKTVVSETLPDDTRTTSTQLTLTRRWSIHDVDPSGTATAKMTILSLRNEVTKTVAPKSGPPRTETVVIDSADPDSAAAVAPFLNKPIVSAKIDRRGGIVDVQSVTGEEAAARLTAELPFRVLLPNHPITINDSWERSLAIKLLPPYGTGEKYDAVQKLTLREIKDGTAVLAVRMDLVNPPSSPADLQPLLSWLWEGEVLFQIESGQYRGAKLTVQRTLKDHQGAGTQFEYRSSYTEKRRD